MLANRILTRLATTAGLNVRSIKEVNSFPYQIRKPVHGVDLRFWIQDRTAKSWYDDGWAKNESDLACLSQLIRPRDTILEFGVHYGVFAAFAAKKTGQDGRYLGVELLPKAAMYAQSQLSLNRCGDRCSILNAAGGAETGTLNFRPSENGNGWVDENSDYAIPVVSGDSLLPKLGQVDLLKIDVEGFEYDVLKGCEEVLNAVPRIALEIHGSLLGRYGHSVKDVLSLIDLDRYSGTMFSRPGLEVVDFDPDKIDEHEITNVFLTAV